MRPKVKVTSSISKVPLELVIKTVLEEKFRAKVLYLLTVGWSINDAFLSAVRDTLIAYLESNRVARNIYSYTVVCDLSNNAPITMIFKQVTAQVWIQFHNGSVVFVPLLYV